MAAIDPILIALELGGVGAGVEAGTSVPGTLVVTGMAVSGAGVVGPGMAVSGAGVVGPGPDVTGAKVSVTGASVTGPTVLGMTGARDVSITGGREGAVTGTTGATATGGATEEPVVPHSQMASNPGRNGHWSRGINPV